MDGYINNKSAAGPQPGIRDIVGTEPATLPTEEFRVTGGGGAIDRAFDTHPAVADSGSEIEAGKPSSPGPGGPDSLLDMREAMFNDGVTGTASRIQLPTGRITRLRGLMIDVDPGKLIPDNPLFPPAEDPREFFGRIQAVLDRHPLARHAEVRSTGTGLHLLLWFEPPVELEDAAGQRRWDGLIRLTQATLPSDPNAPGITALTRPVGSINSKNGARVEKIRRGSPVNPQRVVEFAAQVKAAPFRVVAGILLGSERVTPCPICSGARSALAALDHAGRCYGCGSVSLAALYGAILAAEAQDVAEGDSESARPRASRKAGRKTARTSTRRG